jgi:hypothetical protein
MVSDVGMSTLDSACGVELGNRCELRVNVGIDVDSIATVLDSI